MAFFFFSDKEVEAQLEDEWLCKASYEQIFNQDSLLTFFSPSFDPGDFSNLGILRCSNRLP